MKSSNRQLLASEMANFDANAANLLQYSLDLIRLGCKTHNVHPGKLGGVIILG